MTHFDTDRDVKRALAAHLGLSLARFEASDSQRRIWDELVHDGWVQEVISEPSTFTGLCKRFKTQRRRYFSPVKRAASRRPAVAREEEEPAPDCPEVEEFRRAVLAGRRLSGPEAVAWIQAVAHEERPPTVMTSHDGRGRYAELLAYPGAGGWVGHVAVRRGGRLDALRALSLRLSRRLGWPEAAAVRFILTGEAPRAPVVPRLRWTFGTGEPARVQLEFSPTLAPRAVADFYRQVRQDLLPRAGRALKAKTRALARFDQRGSWAATMAAWNGVYPQWAYRDRRLFARDMKAARKRDGRA